MLRMVVIGAAAAQVFVVGLKISAVLRVAKVTGACS
jgi:hypothetical protein